MEIKRLPIRPLGSGPAKPLAIRPLGRLGGASETTLKADLEAELTEVQKAAKAEAERLHKALDAQFSRAAEEHGANFYLCVVFQTEDQKNTWLLEMTNRGLLPMKSDLKFVSGTYMARAQGIELPAGPDWRAVPEPPKRWKALARPPGST